MRSAHLTLIIAGVWWLSAVAPVPAEDTSVHGRVMGQTEEGEHLGPVPGAKVEFLGRGGASLGSAVADGGGYYRIAGLAESRYVYRITAAGFHEENEHRGVEVSADGSHVLDFVLTKESHSPDDKPDKPGDKPNPQPRKKPGNNSRKKPNNGTNDEPSGSLSVRTWREADGQRFPLPHADVNLRPVDGGQMLFRSTGPQGRNTFPLPAGTWRVSAAVPGGPAVVHPEPIQIAAGGSAHVEFTVPTPPPTPRAPIPTPPTNDGAKACFYGDSANAKRVVFVVDKSNSMRVEKFDEAAEELMRSVNYLTEQQLFYVIFFSDKIHPMFGPEAPSELIPASVANRERLQRYVAELPFHLGTNAHSSMERALALKPDVIYLLGDGAFTDDTAGYLLGLDGNTVPICTVAYQSKEHGARVMKQIAEKHHGRFMYVP